MLDFEVIRTRGHVRRWLGSAAGKRAVAVLVAALLLLGTASVVVAHHNQNEPNDSKSSAAVVSGGQIATTELGTASSLTGNVNGNGDYDEDWFKFTADGDSVTVVLESDPAGFVSTAEGDIGFEVMDAGLSVLGSNNSGKPTADSGAPATIADINGKDSDGDGNVETKVHLSSVTDGNTYYIKVFSHDDPTNKAGVNAAQECGLSSDGTSSCDGEYELFLSFPPTADAGSDASVKVDNSLTFDGSGTTDPDDSTSSLTFDWDFGDGTTTSGTGKTSPSHTYTATGTYTVTLTVTDDGGGTSTDTMTVTVSNPSSSPPDAEVRADGQGGTVTVPEDTEIDFDGTLSSGSIDEYDWEFGDGDGADGDFVRHVFEDPGTYETTLFTRGDGPTDSDTIRVTVTDETAPTAVFGADRTVGVDSSVPFDATNSTDNDALAGYQWSFDDGTTAAGESVTHTFERTGTYEVELAVTDRAGNSDTATGTVTVLDTTPPTADAGRTRTVAVGSSVTLSAAGSTDNTELTGYQWSFGDGTTATGETVTRDFDEMGVHNVTLTVTDSGGNTDSDTVTIAVTAANDTASPAADAGPDRTVTINTPVTLDASGSTDNGLITGYAWELAGSRVARDTTATRTFVHPGTYAMTVRVTDADGNVGTDVANVTVEDRTPPTTTPGDDRVVGVNETVTFDATSATDNGVIDDYRWVIAGVDTAPYRPPTATLEGPDPTRRFAVPGNYTVALTVTDEGNNTATATSNLTVEDREGPIARGGPDRTVRAGETITLDGGNSTDNVGVTRYHWGLGDRTMTTTGRTATHTYEQPGVYRVALTVYDAAGNRDVDFLTVAVE